MAECVASVEQVLSLTKLCAQIILENGGETYRAEETVYRICRATGYTDSDVVALPTGVFINVCGACGNAGTAVRRIKKRTFNLRAVATVNSTARDLIAGRITADEALCRLQRLRQQPAGDKWLLILAAGLSSGSFALLFKGSLFDFAVATVCGMLVQFMEGFIHNDDVFNFAVSLLGGSLIGLISVAAIRLFHMGDLQKIITGAIMPLLPGVAMTNAIRDTMRGDLVSGVTRAAEALLVVTALALGVGVVLKTYYALV